MLHYPSSLHGDSYDCMGTACKDTGDLIYGKVNIIFCCISAERKTNCSSISRMSESFQYMRLRFNTGTACTATTCTHTGDIK